MFPKLDPASRRVGGALLIIAIATVLPLEGSSCHISSGCIPFEVLCCMCRDPTGSSTAAGSPCGSGLKWPMKFVPCPLSRGDMGDPTLSPMHRPRFNMKTYAAPPPQRTRPPAEIEITTMAHTGIPLLSPPLDGEWDAAAVGGGGGGGGKLDGDWGEGGDGTGVNAAGGGESAVVLTSCTSEEVIGAYAENSSEVKIEGTSSCS